MFYVDGGLQENRLARVRGYFDAAAARGAHVARGSASDDADPMIEPTIMIDAPRDTGVRREEILRPVLPVIGYDSISTRTKS